MRAIVSGANVVMFFVFVAFAAVQYNDPDPYLWMPMYGAAAVACLLAWRSKPVRVLAALVALVALVWAGFLAPDVIGKVSFSEMFSSFRMISKVVEEEREMFGLLIVAGWMGVLITGAGTRTAARVG
jgi:hypothetical protein